MRRLINSILVLASLSFSSLAEERPTAFLKAQYTEWHKSRDNNGNAENDQKVKEDKYILQIGNGVSYYYDPQTFYIDSLENDPTGKEIYLQAFAQALHEGVKKGIMIILNKPQLIISGLSIT